MAAVCLILASCQGRRADGTPNGETVDVVLEKATTATDSDTSACDTVAAAMPEVEDLP